MTEGGSAAAPRPPSQIRQTQKARGQSSHEDHEWAPVPSLVSVQHILRRVSRTKSNRRSGYPRRGENLKWDLLGSDLGLNSVLLIRVGGGRQHSSSLVVYRLLPGKEGGPHGAQAGTPHSCPVCGVSVRHDADFHYC